MYQHIIHVLLGLLITQKATVSYGNSRFYNEHSSESATRQPTVHTSDLIQGTAVENSSEIDVIGEIEFNLNDPGKLMTCEGKCGGDQFFPCSCKATCIVYNNCCEDIYSRCPEIIREGNNTFHNILAKTKTTCKSYGHRQFPEYTFINTCAFAPMFTDNIHPSRLDNLLEGAIEECDNGHIRCEQLLKLALFLKNLPYTDRETGLSFINKDIFDCNTLHSAADSMPWRLHLNSISERDVEWTNLDKIAEDVDLTFPVYLPPEESGLSAFECRNSVLDLCSADDIGYHKQLAEQCKYGGMSYVTAGDDPVTYKNKYCAVCVNGRNIEIYPSKSQNTQTDHMVYHDYKFSVQMSLTTEGFHIEKQTPRIEQRKGTWKESVCKFSGDMSFGDKGSSRGDIKCGITKCHEGLFSRKGLCDSILVHISIGVVDEGKPFSTIEHINVGDVLKCFLERFPEMDVENLAQTEVRSQEMQGLWQNMYIYTYPVYLPNVWQNVSSYLRGDLMFDTLFNYYASSIQVIRKSKLSGVSNSSDRDKECNSTRQHKQNNRRQEKQDVCESSPDMLHITQNTTSMHCFTIRWDIENNAKKSLKDLECHFRKPNQQSAEQHHDQLWTDAEWEKFYEEDKCLSFMENPRSQAGCLVAYIWVLVFQVIHSFFIF